MDARWEAVKWEVQCCCRRGVARGDRAIAEVGRAWKVKYKAGPTGTTALRGNSGDILEASHRARPQSVARVLSQQAGIHATPTVPPKARPNTSRLRIKANFADGSRAYKKTCPSRSKERHSCQ